jgi:hypothetical protein
LRGTEMWKPHSDYAFYFRRNSIDFGVTWV